MAEDFCARWCRVLLTFISIMHSKTTSLPWRLRHSWSRECSPFPKSSLIILRLIIRRFSFGMVLNLSPKYLFLWDTCRNSRVVWIVFSLVVKISFWWSWTFVAHLKRNPLIFCCLGLLDKFVFGFLFGSSYLCFSYTLFGKLVVLKEEWWGGAVSWFRLLMLSVCNLIKCFVCFLGL